MITTNYFNLCRMKLKKIKKVICTLGVVICFATIFTACGSSKVTNEEFLETLGEGLTAKWEAVKNIDRSGASTYLEEINGYDTYIQAEWDVIKKYQGCEFADAEFGELASDYLTYMQNAKNAYEYKDDYLTYYAEVCKGLEGAADILTTFAEQYDLYEYIDREYWNNLENSTGVCKQIPTDEIANVDWEGIYEVSFKFGETYQFYVHDIDKETKECGVSVRLDNQEIMDCSAIILDNERLYFELQGADDRKPTKFTMGLTEDAEEPYSLKLINEDYESDDEVIYDLVLDYKVCDGDIKIVRMSEEEWEQTAKEENVDLVGTEQSDSNSQNEFIGMEGTYICTSTIEGDMTGRVDISEISSEGFNFSLGTLELSYSFITEYAQIIDSNTAQITIYGVTLTFSWTDAENMTISRSGEFTGMDAGPMGDITNNQTYTRPLEFNQ